MSEETALVKIENLDVVRLFTEGDGLDKILKDIESAAMAHVPVLDTDAGRKEIASMAYKVTRSKTFLDEKGKELTADWKKKSKIVDQHRKKARDFLDELKAKVRQPLTDWENTEAERVKRHQDKLESMDGLAAFRTIDGIELTSDELRNNLSNLESIKIDDSWEEYKGTAGETKNRCLDVIKGAIERREKYEAEQAELERLRKENEERERLEYERKLKEEAAAEAKRKAEEAARKEREELERREKEAKEAAERAERERIAAEERAKQEAIESAAKAEREKQEAIRATEEKARQEAERAEKERLAKEAREKSEAERIARNKNHRKRINKEAADGFVGQFGVDLIAGLAFVEAIEKGLIPHVKIVY